MNWHNLGGYDWCILESSSTGPFIGLTLGYGLVHEPVTAFGTLQLLAGMLQAELSRPIETSPGQVAVPEVSVQVGSDSTDIGIRGEPSTVLAAWKRLAEIFAGAHPLDPAPPVGVHINAAPRDLTSRFGMTSLTLGAANILDIDVPRDPLQLLGHLNPAAGHVRAVMCTNSEKLVVNAFAPPSSAISAPEPSRYRATARSGAIHFPPGEALISVVVPRSAHGSAALRVLAQQTAHHLASLTQRDDGVTVSLVPVGPDMLATVMTADTIPTPEQRSQVHQLLASRPIPDYRVEQAVQREMEGSQLGTILERRVHALPDDEFVTVHGTQQALATARSTLRFFTEPGSAVPAGFGEAQPELPAPQGQRFRLKSDRSQHLTLGPDVIEHVQSGARGLPDEIERIDLNRLELVIEDSSGGVALIDHEFRVVEIIFDVYQNGPQLRELIAQKTVGVPRIATRNAVQSEPVRQQVKHRRSARRWLILTPVVVTLAIVASSFLTNLSSSQSSEPELTLDAEPQIIALAAGESATLVTGSEVAVHNVTSQSVDLGSEVTVAVEYCAAADQELLMPTTFRLTYGEHARPATPLESTEDSLEVTQLEAGECATGNIGFFIPEQDPTDLKVNYRSGDLNTVTWTVEAS